MKDGKIAKGQDDHLINADHKGDMMMDHAEALHVFPQEQPRTGTYDFFRPPQRPSGVN